MVIPSMVLCDTPNYTPENNFLTMKFNVWKPKTNLGFQGFPVCYNRLLTLTFLPFTITINNTPIQAGRTLTPNAP
jgi:hypothetical protein